jgi:hypothetical protein
MSASPSHAARFQVLSLKPVLLALFTVALTALSLLSATEAEARTRTEELVVTFEKIEVIENERGITIDYAIVRRDWQQLQDAGLHPTLNLYLPNRRGSEYTLHSSTVITTRTGRLFFRGATVTTRVGEVSLELVGRNRKLRVTGMRLKEHTGVTIRVSYRFPQDQPQTQPAPQEPPTRERTVRPRRERTVVEEVYVDHEVVEHYEEIHYDYSSDIIRACRAHTNFASDFDACVLRAQQLYGPIAVDTVHACGTHSNFGSDMTRCLDITLTFYMNPAPVVRTCGQATNFATDMHGCMRAAAPARIDMTGRIQACSEATNFGSDFVRCVERARP